ncbi:hypothetical protein K493DRAFT_43539 [Basidiobolus meristosporus CBS 931.73]|uniref:Uncharacterized protein n=1 Tax=Basidiobolus meristosporus CBS 931.73 TaxID=1314790 RepID=A0A1Y1Y366_9FUNG|nr:hypothetical protein K493DRAFT_43539 [Basidiobolus meristosporus CBS 931.73]|eukprot:ORX92428.1 hypothetical protein K493DRAFT_43539 [Basidiobolus meristosporus CBS 931.73]
MYSSKVELDPVAALGRSFASPTSLMRHCLRNAANQTHPSTPTQSILAHPCRAHILSFGKRKPRCYL